MSKAMVYSSLSPDLTTPHSHTYGPSDYNRQWTRITL